MQTDSYISGLGGFRKEASRAMILVAKKAEERDNARKKLVDGWSAFAVLMGNVAQAQALRQILRWSKNHLPTLGNKPASGEMWLPHEIINASNKFLNNCINRNKNKLDISYDQLVYVIESINPFYRKLNINSLQLMQRNLYI